MNVCSAFFCSGVPPSQPSPYFHERGFRPGSRVKLSTEDPAVKSIVREYRVNGRRGQSSD